jgi:hypothetical protein
MTARRVFKPCGKPSPISTTAPRSRSANSRPNALVVGGGAFVTTGFNDSGTDTLIVGFIGSTTDDNAYATLLDISAVGYIVLDELAATTNIMQTVDATVTCVYAARTATRRLVPAKSSSITFAPTVDLSGAFEPRSFFEGTSCQRSRSENIRSLRRSETAELQ